MVKIMMECESCDRLDIILTQQSERIRVLEGALARIKANASDAGKPYGKFGAEWVAATCLEIASEALTKESV